MKHSEKLTHTEIAFLKAVSILVNDGMSVDQAKKEIKAIMNIMAKGI